MILTAHQPTYLPWLGLFHKISLADTFVFLDDVQYNRNSPMNRNKIKTQSGPTWLTVPVLKRGHLEKKNREIEIDNSLPWRRKHSLSIKQNYGKAQFYGDYSAFLEGVYEMEWKYLTDVNEYLLKWLLETLGIRVSFLKQRDLALRGAKSDLILGMCKQLDADVYISGAGGRNYMKMADFEAAGVKVIFQEYRHPIYPQLFGEFVPNLSVVDLMFNCGPRSSRFITDGQQFPSKQEVYESLASL